jgi:glycosyltransferase involved in cell wall biosynthesis
VQAVKRSRPDAILVPYPGHLLVGEVARATDIPVVLDLFLSAHDTVVGDRGLLRPGSLAARALRRLDQRACAAADLVLLDTEQNAQYVARLTGVRAERLAWVPVSDPAAPAQPAPYRPPIPGERLELLFFGTGVPLHGLSTLLGAVARSEGVRLTLVGGSPEERALARELPGEKLDLKAEFVDRSKLQTLLDRCHLVAGIFGTTAKAGRVVPFKVVHALASARPVLTAETAAVRGLLRLGEEVLTCRAGDVRDLVRALGEARSDPSRLSAVAQQGRVAYDRCFGVAALAARLCALLSDLTGTAMGEAMPSRAERPSALVEVRP